MDAEKEVSKEQLIREQKEKEILSAYLNMSDETKIIIEDIKEMCGLGTSSFLNNMIESVNFASIISYREGQRSIAMMINSRIEEADESIATS